jgi:hypothetical protein
MQTVTITYTIKFILDFASHYKWLDNNQCYNAKTGRIIKQVSNNGSIGYIINGKFKSLEYLRKHLINPKPENFPF